MSSHSTLDFKALKANRNSTARDYWKIRLQEFEFNNYFGYDRVSESYDKKSHSEYILDFPSDVYKILNDIAPSDIAKHIVLLAALGVLAQKYSSISDVGIFTPVYLSGRQEQIDNNILPVRMNNWQELTFKKFITSLKDDLIQDNKHSNYPIAKILNSEEHELKRIPTIGLLVEELQEASAFECLSLHLLFSFTFINAPALKIRFDHTKFASEDVARIAQLYIYLLFNLVYNREEKIKAIEFISNDEKSKILNTFNQTRKDFPDHQTILDLFSIQVKKLPNHVAVQFNDQPLTYAELNFRSNQVANFLIQTFHYKGAIVGIQLDRSPELIIAIYGILKAGCIYLPLTKNYPIERTKYVLEDSEAKVLFTDENNLDLNVGKVKCIDIKSLSSYSKEDVCHALPDDIAYLIYTSGSTGKPKGVLIKHKSIVNRLNWMQNQYLLRQTDAILHKTPIVFDVSIWELFWWSICGAKLVLAPVDAEGDPDKICKIIEDEKIAVLHFVPSMLNAFLNHVSEHKRQHSLKSIKHLFASGEELKAADAQLFYEACPMAELHNLYGPTEATVDVSFHQVVKSRKYHRIPIGKPIDNTSLFIFNRDLKVQPIGIPGELFIGGVNLAAGYLNQVELTKRLFIQSPVDKNAILYKTGDLAKWLPDGSVEFLGRIDNQVKIRGNRIELAEIELAIESFENVKKAIVLTKPSDSTLQLLAYLIVYPDFQEEGLYAFLKSRLPEYMVPSVFFTIDEIPVTINGKVDREKLLSLKKYSDKYVPPNSELEKSLALQWQVILGTRQIGVNDNFFRIGGDSIMAVKLMGSINNHLSLNLSLLDLFENETIKKLASFIEQSNFIGMPAEYKEVKEKVEEYSNDYIARSNNDLIEAAYPMSDIEKGMCFVHLHNPDDILYFEQNIISIHYENFNFNIFKEAIKLLAQKHSILRTGFDLEAFAHIVYKKLEMNVVYYDLSLNSTEEKESIISSNLTKGRLKHFDVTEAPLWRSAIYRLSDHFHVMVFEAHHAIIDGWSYASFITELNNTYGQLIQGGTFEPEFLKAEYKDYIIEELYRKRNKKSLDFWKNDLAGYVKLDLGLKSTEKKYKVIRKHYPYKLVSQLTIVAEQQNTTVKNIFFSAYVYALKMLTHQNDIVVGLVGFNRPIKKDGEKVLGCFLNTLPIRIKIEPSLTWKDFLSLVEDKLNQIRRHDALSLFEINKTIGAARRDENPLFDTLFNFINFHILNDLKPEKAIEPGENALEFNSFLRGHTLFDVNMHVNEHGVQAKYDYVSSFMNDQLFNSFLIFYERILEKIAADPGGRLQSVDIIPEEEKHLLKKFNLTQAPYPQEKTIVDLFEAQVQKTPQNAALRFRNKTLSYLELDELSNRIANYLCKIRGVGVGDLVGIMLEREEYLVPMIFGILKAGAAYVPIDPNYPAERINSIIEDSHLKILLTRRSFERPFQKNQVLILDLDEVLQDVMTCVTGRLSVAALNSSDLAYVIFTSGSTGRPKGVMIEHHSVVNRILWMQKTYPITENDVILQKTPVVFDVSVWELFWWAFTGASLCVIDPGAEKEPGEIIDWIEKHHVTTMHFVPSMLAIFLRNLDESFDFNKIQTLRQVFASGETLKEEHVQLFGQTINKNWNTRLINLYGPTEATVDVTYYECNFQEEKQPIPIGKPIDNTTLYILDKNRQLLPIGTIGELYIAGVGLARGYLNNKGLTQDTFIQNPFVEGETLYKTGDMARWMNDGNIEFLGRIDHQVKMRGFRIELGEIESQLLSYKLVKEAAVLVKETDSDKYLVAYYVSENEIDGKQLKKYLADKLPDYMVPFHYVHLHAFPLNLNGKLDRKALPDREMNRVNEYVPPSNDIEAKLVDIWQELFEVEQIGVYDNFFELGGHSLLAMRLVSTIEKELNVTLSLRTVFRFVNITLLSKYIETEINQNVDPAKEYETIKI